MTQFKKPRRNAYWPVLGLLLALAAGVLAFLAAPAVNQALDSSLPNYPTPTPTLNWMVTAVLFIVFVLIGGLVVAVATPKKKAQVTDVMLTKEREKMVHYNKARKVRQREINKQGKSR